MNKDKKVLFVCLGNICRSPMAEAVFKKQISEKDIPMVVDSAGTGGYHDGDGADPRMIKAGSARGYLVDSISRKILPKDLEDFDYIITMDKSNYENTAKLDPQGKNKEKILPMTQFYYGKEDIVEIPDPYHQGEDGFYYVIDLLEDACSHLVEFILEKK